MKLYLWLWQVRFGIGSNPHHHINGFLSNSTLFIPFLFTMYVAVSTVYFDGGLGLGIGGGVLQLHMRFFADFDFCEM